MTTFSKREAGFEQHFASDADVQFKATIRRNKMLGLWAAEKMGLKRKDAKAYAKDVVKKYIKEPGARDIFHRIRADFDDKGVDQSDHQIRRTMDELMATAIEQVEAES